MDLFLSRNLLMCLQWLMSSDFFVEGCLVWMADNEEFLKQAEVAFFLSGLNMIGPFLVFSMLFCSLCCFLLTRKFTRRASKRRCVLFAVV